MSDESSYLLMEKMKEETRKQHEEMMKIMEEKIIAEKEKAEALNIQNIEMKRSNDIEQQKSKNVENLIFISRSIITDINNVINVYNKLYEEKINEENITHRALESLYIFLKDIIYPLLIDLVKNINPDKINEIKLEHQKLTNILADIAKSSSSSKIHVTGSSDRTTKISGLNTETFNYAEQDIQNG